jgi:late competence protein required for DNA uptake (superfamily II DNA/RNA helicase)
VVAHEAQKWICKRCSGPGTDSKGNQERRICISFICDKFCRHCFQCDRDKKEDCVRVKSEPEFPLWNWKTNQPDNERFKSWAQILETNKKEERLKLF